MQHLQCFDPFLLAGLYDKKRCQHHTGSKTNKALEIIYAENVQSWRHLQIVYLFDLPMLSRSNVALASVRVATIMIWKGMYQEKDEGTRSAMSKRMMKTCTKHPNQYKIGWKYTKFTVGVIKT